MSKLDSAAQLRDENYKKMLERLNEHVSIDEWNISFARILTVLFPQNTVKIAEKKKIPDIRADETRKMIENKLTIAEQNREKEIQKKLENVRKHVSESFHHQTTDSLILLLGFFFLWQELHAQLVREKAALNKLEEPQVPITAE